MILIRISGSSNNSTFRTRTDNQSWSSINKNASTKAVRVAKIIRESISTIAKEIPKQDVPGSNSPIRPTIMTKNKVATNYIIEKELNKIFILWP